ncbi:MAG: zinc-finger domain-containing protein [Burkholderiales bacterium]|nr:MAG: zinc-finger domain-containing protein [Burkholderiales bacterium]
MSSTREMPIVELTAADLPAFCPNQKMPIWNHHPRVFLEVATTGEASCPYCGTRYRLVGAAPAGH